MQNRTRKQISEIKMRCGGQIIALIEDMAAESVPLKMPGQNIRHPKPKIVCRVTAEEEALAVKNAVLENLVNAENQINNIAKMSASDSNRNKMGYDIRIIKTTEEASITIRDAKSTKLIKGRDLENAVKIRMQKTETQKCIELQRLLCAVKQYQASGLIVDEQSYRLCRDSGHSFMVIYKDAQDGSAKQKAIGDITIIVSNVPLSKGQQQRPRKTRSDKKPDVHLIDTPPWYITDA